MGYDLERFSNAPDSLLICPICRKVLEDPVQLDCVRKNNDLISSAENTHVNPSGSSVSLSRRVSLSPSNGTSPNGEASILDTCVPSSAKGTTVGSRKSSRRTASNQANNTSDLTSPPPSSAGVVSRSRKDSTKESESTSKSNNIGTRNLHVFCRSCIVDHFAESGGFSCPIDEEKFKRNTKRSLIQTPPQVILSSLSSLEIACEFAGCSTVTTISSLADHLEECTFKPPPVIKINLSCLTPSSSGSTLGDYHAVPNYHSSYSAQSRQYISNNNNNNTPLSQQQQQQSDQVHNYTSQYVACQQQQSPYSIQSNVSSLYSNQQSVIGQVNATSTASTSFPDYYSNYYSSGQNNYYALSGNTPSTCYDGEDDSSLNQRQHQQPQQQQQQQQLQQQQQQQCTDPQQFISATQQSQSLGYKRKKKHAHIYMEMDDKLNSIERRYQEKLELVRSQLHSRLDTVAMNQLQRIESKYQKDTENLERNHRCQLMLFEEKIKNELDTMKNFIRSSLTTANVSSVTSSLTVTPSTAIVSSNKKQGRVKSRSNTVQQVAEESSITGSFFASFGPITETSLSLTDELQASLANKIDSLCQSKNEQLIALVKSEAAKTQQLLQERQSSFESKLLAIETTGTIESTSKGKRNTRSGETIPSSTSSDSVAVKCLKVQLNKCHEILKRTQEQVMHIEQEISKLETGKDKCIDSESIATVTTVDKPSKATPGRKRKNALPVNIPVTAETLDKLHDDRKNRGDDEDDADTVILTDTSTDTRTTAGGKGRRGGKKVPLVHKSDTNVAIARKKVRPLSKMDTKSPVVANIRKKALGKATITMANIVTGKTRSAIKRTVQQVTPKKQQTTLVQKRGTKKTAIKASVPVDEKSVPLEKNDEKTEETIKEPASGDTTSSLVLEETTAVEAKKVKQVKRKGRPPAVKESPVTKADATVDDESAAIAPPTKKAKVLKEPVDKKRIIRKGKPSPPGKNESGRPRRSVRQQPTPPTRAKKSVQKSKDEEDASINGEKGKTSDEKEKKIDEKDKKNDEHEPLETTDKDKVTSAGEASTNEKPDEKDEKNDETISQSAKDSAGRQPRRGCGFRGRGRSRLKSGSGASFPSSRRGGVGISRDATIDSLSVPPTPSLSPTDAITDSMNNNTVTDKVQATVTSDLETSEKTTDPPKQISQEACEPEKQSTEQTSATKDEPSTCPETNVPATTSDDIPSKKDESCTSINVEASKPSTSCTDKSSSSDRVTSDQGKSSTVETTDTSATTTKANDEGKEATCDDKCDSNKETNISPQSCNAKVGDDILRAAMDAIDDADQDDLPSINSRNVLTNANSLPLPPVASIAGKQFFASFPLSIPFSLPVVFGRVSSANVSAGTSVTGSMVTATPLSSVTSCLSKPTSSITNVTYASTGSSLSNVTCHSTATTCTSLECASNITPGPVG